MTGLGHHVRIRRVCIDVRHGDRLRDQSKPEEGVSDTLLSPSPSRDRTNAVAHAGFSAPSITSPADRSRRQLFGDRLMLVAQSSAVEPFEDGANALSACARSTSRRDRTGCWRPGRCRRRACARRSRLGRGLERVPDHPGIDAAALESAHAHPPAPDTPADIGGVSPAFARASTRR